MLAPQKLKAQTRAVIEASALVLWQCLVRRQPADRVLAAHLRGHKEFGSRDRRLISETVYALFRWWGWLKPLAPAQFMARMEEAAAIADPAANRTPLDIHAVIGGFRTEQWSPLLLGALVVEHIEAPDMAEWWGDACGLRLSDLGYCAAPQRPVTRANRYFEVLAKSQKMLERAPASTDLTGTLKREIRAVAGMAPEPEDSKRPDLGLHQTVPAWVASETALEPKAFQELLEWLQRRPPLWVRLQPKSTGVAVGPCDSVAVNADADRQTEGRASCPAMHESSASGERRARTRTGAWASRPLSPGVPPGAEGKLPVGAPALPGNATRETILAELAEAKLAPEPHPRLENAAATHNNRVNFYTLPAYSEGRVEIQDLASQCIGTVCAPAPGERWWDPCAGAGGKSLLLAQLMQGKGVVIASDIREHKLEDLKKRARRGGFFNITPKAWDGKPLPARKATYDGVLVDAPCSCSGTWRRNPAARWSTAPAEVVELAETQLQILKAAASGVKPGGVLVYATCSFFKRENEAVARAFAESAPEFELEPFPHPLTGEPTPGFAQFWPWEGDCDAMFAARFRRKKAAAAGSD